MTRTYSIGCDATSDIPLADPTISREHGGISILDDGRIEVVDVGSTNGTFLIRAGQRTPIREPTFVSSDDELAFGDLTLPVSALLEIVDAVEKGRAGPESDSDNSGGTPDRRDRDDNHATGRSRWTDFVPIVEAFQRMKERGLLFPAVALIIFIGALSMRAGFSAIPDAAGTLPQEDFLNLLGASITLLSFFAVYRLCGKHKPLIVIAAVMASEFYLLAGPLLPPDESRFRHPETGAFAMHPSLCEAKQPVEINLDTGAIILDPETCRAPWISPFWTLEWLFRPAFLAVEEDAPFISRFLYHFTGAGLYEEFFKMLPVLFLVWLTLRSTRPDRSHWGVTEPLDAVVYACATASVFVMDETLFSLGAYVRQVLVETPSVLDRGEVDVFGIQIGIIRTLRALPGHLAYSGYFAYFIGLGLLRPLERYRLWAGGFVLSSVIHGLNNSVPDALNLVVSLAALLLLLAVIVNARKLSPTRSRNFATLGLTNRRLRS